MSIRKTYRSLVYKELDTYVLVDGVKRLIQFRGGSLQPRINGIYVTEDPKVIEAMDSDRGNGTSFVCIRSEGEPDEKKKTVKPVEKKKEPVEDIEEVPGITNLQDARNYMLSRFQDLRPSQLNNTIMVRAQAVKKGIKFTELV
jgi:hypothetical protein